MSKTKFLSKQTIFITILIIVIIALAWYNKGIKESFNAGNINSKDLKNALNLFKQVNLPDNLLSGISSVPTLTKNLPFSNVKEPFYGMGDLAISSFASSKSTTSTKNWSNQNLTNKKSAGTKQIMNRPPQPIPLPNGELDMFATTQFKPSCCPNTYSNSMGCACMTTKQYKYLIDRGGNNVPYSEY